MQAVSLAADKPAVGESLKLGEAEYEDIRSNKKVPSGKGLSKTYCENLLLKFDPGYTKTSLDFKNRYMSKVSDAVDNADSFDTDLERLENHIGSNIGQLIKELRGV